MPEKKLEKDKKTAKEEKPSETTVEFLASLAEVLVTGLFIVTFILQAFEIPSSSMEDTLLIGDHLFVNREQFAPPARWMGPLMPYRDVHRDEIAVFLSPEQPGLFLDQNYAHSEGRKHGCVFDTDHATADHDKGFRNALHAEDLVAVDNRAAVNRHEW